jgi:hypothetical protein
MSVRQHRVPLGLALLASLLPVAGAVVPGLTYYFRDFTVTFYPQRWLFATEIAAGRLPAWNPFVQEGTFLLPALYPVDLLHALGPSPAWVSWLLTLHFPLAAAAAYGLARQLGVRPGGAGLAGALYASAGLAASSLNLYVFLQAYALAPLVALTLVRALEQGGRAIAIAALVLGAALSTLAVEFVGQAALLGLVVGQAWRSPRRGVSAVTLGVALAGLPVAILLGLLGETARGAGFGAEVALGHAVHPFGLVQVVVPQLFGSLAAPVESWWGHAFFSRGFPYFLSFHLGPLALALAVAGAATPGRGRRALLGLGALGLLYALGPWGGLAPLLQRVPGASLFRFPSKAMLLPTLAAVLLAGRGWDRVSAGEVRALGRTCLGLLALLASLAAAFLAFPGAALAALGGDPAVASRAHAWVPAACVAPLALCLAGAALALAAGRAVVTAPRAALVVALLAAADSVVAARGMNPQVPARYFELLPELRALHLDELGGGRVFSYGMDDSPALRAFLAGQPPGAALWSFFVSRQMLTPYTNVLDRVELAEAKDLTSLVPNPPELRPEDHDPARVGSILDYLRNQAVSRVLSLDPLQHADLRELAIVPTGAAGLSIHVYELLRPWPRVSLACRAHPAQREGALGLPFDKRFDPLRDVAVEPGAPAASCSSGTARVLHLGLRDEEHEVESDGPGYLVVRSAQARGWTASVDGVPARVYRANGRHRAVAVPAGRHRVLLHYDPPGLWSGLALFAAGALGVVTLLVAGGRGKMPTP